MIYHLIKFQKNNLQLDLILQHVRVLRGSYKKIFSWLCRGKKILEKTKRRTSSQRKSKNTTAEPPSPRKKEFFFLFPISTVLIKQTKKAKFLFFSILLLKRAFKPTRVRNLNFQAKITTKTVKILWRKNQYCINHPYILLLLLSI